MANFIDDILLTGGPEKEFIFRNRYYFLETVLCDDGSALDLHVDEYDNSVPQEKIFLTSHHFKGDDMATCVQKFESAAIFAGMTVYQAEQEIEVLFG